MNVNKIMFPTDFSQPSDAPLALAVSLARDSGAKLLIVHVAEPALAYAGELYYGVIEPNAAELQGMLQQVIPADPSVAYEHRLLVGDPVSELTRLARDEDVDLIVMGTHGRTGLKRLVLGSIAEEIVRSAPCPVLTFKQQAQRPTNKE